MSHNGPDDEVDGCGSISLKSSLHEEDKNETSVEEMEPDILTADQDLLSPSKDLTSGGEGQVMYLETTEKSTSDAEVPGKTNQGNENDDVTVLRESANALHITPPVVNEGVGVANNSETTSVPMETDSENKGLHDNSAADKDLIENNDVTEDNSSVTIETVTGISSNENITKGNNCDNSTVAKETFTSISSIENITKGDNSNAEKTNEEEIEKMVIDENLEDLYKSQNDTESVPGFVITEVRSETWTKEVQNSEAPKNEAPDDATQSENEVNKKANDLQMDNEISKLSDVAQPVHEAPAADVAQPVHEAPAADVAQPVNEAPAADVAQPVHEAPAADVAQPVNEAPAVTNPEDNIAPLQQTESENSELQSREEKTDSQVSEVLVVPSSQTSSETESNNKIEPTASDISSENESKKSETIIRAIEPKSFPSYFDSSEASESDQSPRLVIAMPDPDVDSESTESPVKGKGDNSVTSTIETAPVDSESESPVKGKGDNSVTSTIETAPVDGESIESPVKGKGDNSVTSTIEAAPEVVDKNVDSDMLSSQNRSVTQNSEIVIGKEGSGNMTAMERVAEKNDENASTSVGRDVDQHQNQVSSNTAINKVTVKQEPMDCVPDSHAEEGAGDILDILNAQNTKNSVIVTDKSDSIVNTGFSSSKPRIKTEPADHGYEMHQDIFHNSGNFTQSCSSNRNPMLNVRSIQSSNSLSKLSQQVADLPQAVRPTKLPASQNRMQAPVSTHIPNNARFQVPHSVTRMPVVLQLDQHSNPRKAYTLVPLSQAGTQPTNQQRILKKTVISDTMNKGASVISKVSRPVVTTATTLAKKVPIPASTGGSIVKNSVTIVKHKETQKLDTPAVLQNNVRLAQSDLPVTSINIDTVGLGKITELIARKNPIPNYKPPPVPEDLKKVLGSRPTFVCYECGDTYALADSLVQHRGRYSMKIVFKCDDCNAEKTFFNKCQFLSHLRGHLNIDKTKAVPIHIKSDSIVISTLPEEYQKMMFKQTNIKASKSPALNLQVLSIRRCRECGLQVDNKEFQEHYGQYKIECDLYRNICVQCHMRLPSVCALRGHRRIHRFQSPLVCPECGTDQFRSLSPEPFMDMWTGTDFYSYHLRDVCFHLSRSLIIPCPKCNQDMTSVEMLKSHLMQNLEQYFKCQDCPMAFKSQETFKKHYEQHMYVPSADKNRRHFKVIYRCHICDSVMDDAGVLQIHTNHHVLDKAIYKFKCLCCSQYFKDKEELSEHFHSQHHEARGTKKCTICHKQFNGISAVVRHQLTEHNTSSSSVDTYKSCGDCGLMLNSREISRHSLYYCLAKKVNVYECKICSKRLSSKQAHTNHMKTHTTSEKAMLGGTESLKNDFTGVAELIERDESCSVSGNVDKSDDKLEDLRPPSTTNFHTNVGVHPCTTENCSQSFVTLEELNQHRKNDHGLNLLFPCHLCGLTYENQVSLHQHIRLTHEAKRHVYSCWICRSRKIKKVFSSAAMLEKHVTTRHRIPKDQLDYSLFVREYDNASDNELGGRNFQEDLKRKSRLEPDSPVKRLRLEGENVFNCAKCVYSSEDRTVFLNHILTHKIEKYVQCLECGLSFAVLPALRKHLFMVHKIKDFDSYCQEKGIEQIKEEVLNDQDLVLTVQSDESEDVQIEDEYQNPLECRVCHKVFESENNVRAHMRTHGMAFIRSKRQATKSSNSVANGNESSDSSHSSYSAQS